MQMASSASWTCMELASASEYTATVRMFSSLQARMIRTAISPRLATRSFSNMEIEALRCLELRRAELEERLAVLNWLGVFYRDLGNDSFGLGLDFVHHLHGRGQRSQDR